MTILKYWLSKMKIVKKLKKLCYPYFLTFPRLMNLKENIKLKQEKLFGC